MINQRSLPDGSTVTIRPETAEDAAGLFATERAIIIAGIGVVQGLDDIPGSIEEYRERICERQSAEAAERNLCYAVAEKSGQIVGYGQIERLGPTRTRHVASIALGVHPHYQNMGIGRSLMEYLIAWARSSDDPPIVRVELSVQADNRRARHLYESLGFELEGIRRCFVRDLDGQEHDDCIMALFINRDC